MTDNCFRLKDGRILGYADCGKTDGIPIFLFHGTPGSRISGLEDEPLLEKYGIRVIAPERPGYGLSSPKPERTITDWVKDIEELAAHLGLKTFHVAGGSGGGPYVLACSLLLAPRVKSGTIIGSAVPPKTLLTTKGMAIGNKIGFLLAKYFPYLLKISFRSYENAVKKYPDKLLQQMLTQLCEWDKSVLQKQAGKGEKLFLLHLTEAFKQGSDATYIDFLLISRPWGFKTSNISVPVFMWHGECDTLMPIAPAKEFATLLPTCECHFIPGAGHLLLESDEIGAQIVEKILSVKD
jgi:pimeloyl-ACP methyl ester carboxylesterase